MDETTVTDFNLPVQAKVSKLAITAISFAFFSLVLDILLFFSAGNPLLLEKFLIFFYFGLFSLVAAFLLGLISLMRIDKKGGEITGSNFAVAAIVISILVFLVSYMFLPALSRMRFEANREVCSRNLSIIGKAMLRYSEDYNGEFPRAGGESSSWGTQVKWNTENQEQAFGIDSDGAGGSATVSSSLYLLVKYSGSRPENFVCIFDKKIKKFNQEKYGMTETDLTKLWDFGPEPWKHVSYAYDMPYDQYQIKDSSDPGMALMADRNPWIPCL